SRWLAGLDVGSAAGADARAPPCTKNRSRSPSPSASNVAAPVPMISGMKKRPLRPLWWTKSTPSWRARSTSQSPAAAPPAAGAHMAPKIAASAARRCRTDSSSGLAGRGALALELLEVVLGGLVGRVHREHLLQHPSRLVAAV